MIPQEPMMMLSYINTKLRDFYPDLKYLCEEEGVEEEQIISKLAQIHYSYDKEKNQFV